VKVKVFTVKSVFKEKVCKGRLKIAANSVLFDHDACLTMMAAYPRLGWTIGGLIIP
jgi:hypothetical protein